MSDKLMIEGRTDGLMIKSRRRGRGRGVGGSRLGFSAAGVEKSSKLAYSLHKHNKKSLSV